MLCDLQGVHPWCFDLQKQHTPDALAFRYRHTPDYLSFLEGSTL